MVLSALSCRQDPPAPTPEPEPEPVVEVKSSDCRIFAMSVEAGEWTLECEIDTVAGTIALPCFEEDLSSLKSTKGHVTLAEGANITPNPAVSKDYRKGATYIVTAEDGTEKIYTLSLKMLQTPERPAKPVVMWIDAENSCRLLNTRAKVADVVKTAWDNGFSGIVMDVKSPRSGDVLYTSSFLGYCPRLKETDIPQDFDLLQELVDRCHEQGMTITASVSVMTFPRPATLKGQDYFDNHLDGAICREFLPEGIIDQREDPEASYIFLNPANPATHDYMIAMVSELARNYDLDGIALDYCRFPDVRSDFSETSRSAFEQWSGTPVENWPDDIIKYSTASRDSWYKCPRFKEWVKWRSSLIQGCVRDCRDAIKAINPSIRIEYWAEAWWWECWAKGQNWAAQKASLPSGYTWASEDYMTTGFADYLDIFHLGSYVHTVYGFVDQYTMEYLANYGKNRILDACTLYGSFGAYVNNLDYAGATILNYRTFDGVMIFELGSVKNRWGTYKNAIRRAMRLEGEYGRP